MDMAWRHALQLQSETASFLSPEYGTLALITKHLAKVLHYKIMRVLLNTINSGICPVHCFRVGKNRIASVRLEREQPVCCQQAQQCGAAIKNRFHHLVRAMNMQIMQAVIKPVNSVIEVQ